MSKIKLPLAQAEVLASKIVTVLSPGCSRIEIAGSVRRLRPEVGDIEIVCIPKQYTDLFGAAVGSVLDMVLFNLIETGRLLPGDKNGERYKTFYTGLAGVKLDLFITTPEQWGVNFTIRTGPAEFSQRLVTQRDKGGLLPSDLRVSGARVWRGAEALDTCEERKVFEVIGGPGWWIEPKDRN